jgi:hypothetical protein
MKFAIKVTCIEHNRTVIPASEQLHFIPDTEDITEAEWHELDLADTWCPVSGTEHRYSIQTIVQE